MRTVYTPTVYATGWHHRTLSGRSTAALFSIAAYEIVVEADLAGLEALVAQGRDSSGVASFFISRMDSAIDRLILARLTTARRQGTGATPPEPSMLVDNGMQLSADAQNALTLANAAGGSVTLVGYLQAHLNHMQVGDYFCVWVYIEMNATHRVLLQTM